MMKTLDSASYQIWGADELDETDLFDRIDKIDNSFKFFLEDYESKKECIKHLISGQWLTVSEYGAILWVDGQ